MENFQKEKVTPAQKPGLFRRLAALAVAAALALGLAACDVSGVAPGGSADVIPNPAFTPFLQEADKRGLKWQSGLSMLVNQAALNITMWTELDPDKEVMKKALEEALS